MRFLLMTSTALLAFATSAFAQDEAATVQAQAKEPLGAYLTDAEGMSLYVFLADTKGSAEGLAESTCYDACAEAWPPLLTAGQPVPQGETVAGAMLGNVDRRDGSAQVTYNGWPLYGYHEDAAVGDTKGQNVEEFGAEWYLISPAGEPIEEDDQ